MLLRLRVQNLALIDAVELALEPGFNVFTGETGAGKSILIDAIDLLLGRRARPEDVRTGARAAYVDGVFAPPPSTALAAALEAYGIEPDESLLISREVIVDGVARSVARVNGRAVPVRALVELGPHLIDIHGQVEHQSLFRAARQLEYLDRYGGLAGRRQTVAQLVDRWRAIKDEEATLRRDARETARLIDLLSFQVNEIDGAGLSVDEDEALRVERQVLANAQRLRELAGVSERLLTGDDAGAAVDRLGEAMAALAEIADLDPAVKPAADQIAEAQAVISDAAQSLAAYAADIQSDPARLEEINARLDVLDTLKRKYGDSLADVLAFADDARRQLSDLGASDDRRRELAVEQAALESDLARAATDLRTHRLAAAKRLTRVIAAELADLNLPDAAVEFPLDTRPDAAGLVIDAGEEPVAFDRSGVDAGEMQLSVNRGQPVRPLAAVASGGEMSRILLGLKSALAAADETPTLIFDEIDVGVGGRSGDVVGQKLARLAQAHQVLCVTHLPSVAAFADTHFVVEKHEESAGTITNVRRLDRDAVVEEVAAMGGSHTTAGRRVARDLLADAAAWKHAGQADRSDGYTTEAAVRRC
ncbi:MAG: DNA repair protein RecN [Chloroflexota bacterium]|nr:DNA repair protein RecN [Chloroflexota bacterium]